MRRMVRIAAALGVMLALFASAVRADVFVVPVPVRPDAKAFGVPAGDVVELFVVQAGIGDTTAFRSLSTLALAGGDYIVPANRQLVVTSLQVTPRSPDVGSIELSLQQDGTSELRTRRRLLGSAAEMSSLAYAPGLVFPAGTRLLLRSEGTNPTGVRVDLMGYLVGP